MTPPIVVGVDPLRHDPEAPVLAALLARATGAPVVAVAAYPVAIPVRIGGGDAYEHELRGTALARLTAIEPGRPRPTCSTTSRWSGAPPCSSSAPPTTA